MKTVKDKLIQRISDFVDNQGTLVQEDDFEQVLVHHLTSNDKTIYGDFISYIGKDAVFCKSGKKYEYVNLPISKIKIILDIIL